MKDISRMFSVLWEMIKEIFNAVVSDDEDEEETKKENTNDVEKDNNKEE